MPWVPKKFYPISWPGMWQSQPAPIDHRYEWIPNATEPPIPDYPHDDYSGQWPLLNGPYAVDFNDMVGKYTPIGLDKGSDSFKAMAVALRDINSSVDFVTLCQSLGPADERSTAYIPELAANYGRTHAFGYLVTNSDAQRLGYAYARECAAAATANDHLEILQFIKNHNLEINFLRCAEVAIFSSSLNCLRWLHDQNYFVPIADHNRIKYACRQIVDFGVINFLKTIHFNLDFSKIFKNMISKNKTDDAIEFLRQNPQISCDGSVVTAVIEKNELGVLQKLHAHGAEFNLNHSGRAKSVKAWDVLLWLWSMAPPNFEEAKITLSHAPNPMVRQWIFYLYPQLGNYIPSNPPCLNPHPECSETDMDPIAQECIPLHRLYKYPETGKCYDINTLRDYFSHSHTNIKFPDSGIQMPNELINLLRNMTEPIPDITFTRAQIEEYISSLQRDESSSSPSIKHARCQRS